MENNSIDKYEIIFIKWRDRTVKIDVTLQGDRVELFKEGQLEE